jgi:hypothetical protein
MKRRNDSGEHGNRVIGRLTVDDTTFELLDWQDPIFIT